MILESFRVTEFRSVKDSGWIDTEQITALIGTNESGKTNILLPLWKLNPADEGKIDLKADLPRDKYHTYRLAKPKPIFIRAKYTLLDEEKLELSKISGHDNNEFSQVIVSKDFDGNLFYEFPHAVDQDPIIIDNARRIITACKGVLETGNDAAGKSENERREKALQIIHSALELLKGTDARNVLALVNTELQKFDDDVKSSVTCATMANALQQLQPLMTDSKQPTLCQSEKVTTYIKEQMPKYVYYSNYGNLDSQIYLPQVLQNISRTDLGVKDAAKARTLKTLFKFVQLDPQEITDLKLDLQRFYQLLDYVNTHQIRLSLMMPVIGSYQLAPRPLSVQSLQRFMHKKSDGNYAESIQYYYTVHDALIELVEKEQDHV